jgi:hypothetical protein|tara:strand:- start:500 stop:700 length:201 start_codon:yes stop_codon:yes gene_type:complete
MSLAKKKLIDLTDENSNNEKVNQRPNIDHLIKRILIERRREKKNNIVLTFIALLGTGIVAFFFTQN